MLYNQYGRLFKYNQGDNRWIKWNTGTFKDTGFRTLVNGELMAKGNFI